MIFYKFLQREEFACKCGCGFDTVDIETYYCMVRLRKHFGRPLIINSACRCEEHNALIGGARNSYHLKARAVDFFIIGVSLVSTYTYLCNKYPGKYGMKLYSSFIHFDTRHGVWRG